MPIYPVVLQAVAEANGITDDEQLAEHLATLVPALHALRSAYRTAGRQVVLDYSRELTEAYLLAYYPHYVRMTDAALRVVGPEVFRTPLVRACVFGGGPAPEAVAIGRRLQQHGNPGTALQVAVIDRSNDAWTWARSVSVERVLEHYWPGTVEVRPLAGDLAAPDLVDGSIAAAAEEADLVIFQNCLNELGDDPDRLRESVLALVDRMGPGSVMVMSDLDNYPAGRRALALVVETLGNGVRWLRRADERLTLEPASPVPPLLLEHFFVGGEYPRRNPFPWRSLAFVR